MTNQITQNKQYGANVIENMDSGGKEFCRKSHPATQLFKQSCSLNAWRTLHDKYLKRFCLLIAKFAYKNIECLEYFWRCMHQPRQEACEDEDSRWLVYLVRSETSHVYQKHDTDEFLAYPKLLSLGSFSNGWRRSLCSCHMVGSPEVSLLITFLSVALLL